MVIFLRGEQDQQGPTVCVGLHGDRTGKISLAPNSTLVLILTVFYEQAAEGACQSKGNRLHRHSCCIQSVRWSQPVRGSGLYSANPRKKHPRKQCTATTHYMRLKLLRLHVYSSGPINMRCVSHVMALEIRNTGFVTMGLLIRALTTLHSQPASAESSHAYQGEI